MNDKKRNTTVRLSENTLETLKTYSEIENTSMTEFFNDLLSDALKEYFIQRAGGEVMAINNPQFADSDKSTDENWRTALNILADAVKEMPNTEITPLLYHILAFYNQRLFFDLPEDKEKYKMNKTLDS